MEHPPQPGEVWINIHTSHKVNVEKVEDVKGARGGKVVVYNHLVEGHIETARHDLPGFQAHHKRHGSANKWFLGALGG